MNYFEKLRFEDRREADNTLLDCYELLIKVEDPTNIEACILEKIKRSLVFLGYLPDKKL